MMLNAPAALRGGKSHPGWGIDRRIGGIHARPMAYWATMTRVLGSVLCLAVAGFCVFGFLASYEPMDAGTQAMWKTIYSVAGGAAIAGGLACWLRDPARDRHS